MITTATTLSSTAKAKGSEECEELRPQHRNYIIKDLKALHCQVASLQEEAKYLTTSKLDLMLK